ncbi:hypothetical protein [Dechloromonas sp. H13]|uniref:hypothetical protein n=1 Tax=Dechloromonas sp. H13 TaxID=2570193 RepID=UPI0012927EFF|nr:hypothetical protein [Dechloromonas sp. H13]
MSKIPVIKCDPANLTYIDEAELQTKTNDEEWQDLYDMDFRPSDFKGKARAAFEDFIKRNGYEL